MERVGSGLFGVVRGQSVYMHTVLMHQYGKLHAFPPLPHPPPHAYSYVASAADPTPNLDQLCRL
jgi:hypothetical protein